MTPIPQRPLIALAFVSVSLAIPGSLSALAPSYPVANAAASGAELPPYLQCVPYAREVSGIDIYGDAHTWWTQAAGRFERGSVPRVGAVMAFVPHRSMRLGHVAAVARIIDSRTVLLDHANWSPINGRRGQIERGVKAIDVSPANDWSEVRVWYDPLQGLGTTAWPVQGFIYRDGEEKARPRQQFAQARPQPVRPHPTREEPSRAFLAAFSGAAQPARSTSSQSSRTSGAYSPQRAAPQRIAYAAAQSLPPLRATVQRRTGDVAARAVALYD